MGMEEKPTFDEYRTGYIAGRWNVSDNCAKALQLFEIGFTCSGASKHLPVTESTVKRYHGQLMDKIHPNIVFPIAGKGRNGQYDVWGERTMSEYASYDYADGEAHGQQKRQSVESAPVTTSEKQLDPQFREQPPLNTGVPISQISTDLISIDS